MPNFYSGLYLNMLIHLHSHHRTDVHVPMRQQKHQDKPPDPGIERAARRFIRKPRGELVREAKERDPQKDVMREVGEYGVFIMCQV